MLQTMADGLYQVMYKGICAGFVIEGGRVVRCAPVLRRRLSFWKTVAKRIGSERHSSIRNTNVSYSDEVGQRKEPGDKISVC